MVCWVMKVFLSNVSGCREVVRGMFAASQRRRWVAATPEEQVRQYSLYVLRQMGYSPAHIAVERAFYYLSRRKRLDVLVCDVKMRPFLLLECKRSDAPLSDADLTQLLSYNAYWKAPAMAIFNGVDCYCLQRAEVGDNLIQRRSFPPFPR